MKKKDGKSFFVGGGDEGLDFGYGVGVGGIAEGGVISYSETNFG